MNPNPSHLPSHGLIPEPYLAFHPDRVSDRHVNPITGLLEFGPYSRSLSWVLDPIRIAAIFPNGDRRFLQQIFDELESKHQPRERRTYLSTFPGFARVFGVGAVPAPESALIELSDGIDSELSESSRPHQVLADHINRAMSLLESQRSEFDVVLVILPKRWESGFNGGTDDFDLHDYIKAVGATRAMPTQIVLEDGALAYPCRCSVMWHLSIALYSKAGGIPWRIADVDPDVAFIGLGYALKSTRAGLTRFVTCCSQVFDADGAGLEFIAFETSSARIERDNPFLNRADMMRLVSRSASLYQHRHAGRLPRRMIVHKSTHFRDEEIDGCYDAWPRAEGLELIQVQQSTPWLAAKIEKPGTSSSRKGKPSTFPVDRGTFLHFGDFEVLLWTQGNAKQAVSQGNYFKEGRGIPRPIVLRRFAGHGDWAEKCQHVLALTKMNWNNDSLYDFLPVTLRYANILARTVKRVPQIHPRPYQFRFFM